MAHIKLLDFVVVVVVALTLGSLCNMCIILMGNNIRMTPEKRAPNQII